MSRFSFYPWSQYSKKLIDKILHPISVGTFSEHEAKNKNMRLAIGEDGKLTNGNVIRFYLLVDESDGIIADARFQAFGDSALIGAAEILCEIILRKNYDQASRISAELVENHVSHKGKSFPIETFPHINLALFALQNALEKCTDIPFADSYAPPPVVGIEGEPQYPNFPELNLEQKKEIINQIIQSDIQPYIELDAGGIEISKIEDLTITVKYSGTCTSCYSATGATLNAIQQILKTKVNKDIIVAADASVLTFMDA